MKLKLLDIVDSRDALTRLSRRELPIRISYRIQRNFRLVKQETKEYDKSILDLVEKYEAVEIAPGNFKIADETKRRDCNKEIQAFRDSLNDVSVELDIIKLSMDDIENITPEDLGALEFMFEEPQGESSESHKSRPRNKNKVN